ncbi:CarD family transcriptional regulator [Mesobacillus maritimus]|uniref:CarD family transcriptional regulator n=1 Tax=Mesobacillus maritimus TaxID=1643336 RepID=UPI00203D4AE5|nr:CarD family transcriptional regulator [Mesobacillus maritimus]MCM3588815.1 CarD family transcriptional regulator [Mesobacillus maritimus]MCM3670679.1 CarD family transcriptional regulator [Mesobacillus maritimus]
MFNIGDLIIYSGHGICKIDDICEKTISGITRMYYVLHPMENNPPLTISTPVNNDKVIMMNLLDQDEANEILESFKQPGVSWNDNANLRNTTYSDIVKSGNRKEIAKVVNTLFRKKLEAEQKDKKLYERDQKLLSTTQAILFKELAICLNISVDEVHDRILKLISKQV